MLFSSPLYGAFLLAVFACHWLLKDRRLPRLLFLVAVSYGFYFYGTLEAAWEARDLGRPVPFGDIPWAILCLAIIFLGSSLDFWIGKKLARTESPRGRKALLLASVLYYLGILAVFKYFNFFVDSFVDLFAFAGVAVKPVHLRLVLPFGISFFTFETMSYTIDVYRKEIEPAQRYLDYLLFVCFFPHLVAGPIVRPEYMLPQLARAPVFDPKQQTEGLWLIATGMAKKVILGDTLQVNIVKRVFDNPERFSGLENLVAVYAYAVYIYANFSGYTDVARGSAKLLGFELPLNFDAPYISKNLQEFWRRWHISLSTWLRDYLYKPLGGSRGGTILTYRNLFLTMLFGGFWHGAKWTFVIWGALHGVALAGTRIWQRWREDEGEPPKATQLGRAFATVLTFHYVCFAWIFFNADSFAVAKLMIVRIATAGFGTTQLATPGGAKVLAVIAVGMILHFVPKSWDDKARELFVKTPIVVQGVVLAAAAVAVHLAAGAKVQPLIYGQF
ncbi:MBOAT family protein [soil metagenome]